MEPKKSEKSDRVRTIVDFFALVAQTYQINTTKQLTENLESSLKHKQMSKAVNDANLQHFPSPSLRSPDCTEYKQLNHADV